MNFLKILNTIFSFFYFPEFAEKNSMSTGDAAKEFQMKIFSLVNTQMKFLGELRTKQDSLYQSVNSLLNEVNSMR